MKTKLSLMARFIVLILLCNSINVFGQSRNINIDYFGQTPPEQTAIVFAPNFISIDSVYAQTCTISPNGKEFYFTVTNNRWDYFEIRYSNYVNGKWTIPARADFLGTKDNMEPFFSLDGKGIYFNSGDINGTDIWYCEKESETWSKPIKLPEPVNTSSFEWYPSVSKKKTLFLTRNGDIYFFSSQNGIFNSEVNIGSPINSNLYEEADPYISPNEDYLIFHSYGRPDGYGQGDLYISYKKENGLWTNPKNLGTKINSEEFEFGPSITPDGKYFMFSRRKQWQTDIPSKIYWIKSDFIDSLRHTNFVPYVKNNISNQSATINHLFSYVIPDTTFIDDDGNNTIIYSATLSDGSPLSSWLSFNSAARIFNGTPSEKGSLKIKVTVTDKAKAMVSCEFEIHSDK